MAEFTWPDCLPANAEPPPEVVPKELTQAGDPYPPIAAPRTIERQRRSLAKRPEVQVPGSRTLICGFE